MDPLTKWEEDLKNLCTQLPHWQQIQLQGFWYGLVSWLITCAEEGINPTLHAITAQELAIHSDPKFESWPSEWLQPYADTFIALRLSYEDLHTWFATLDTVFRDCISTDLDIFSILAEGAELTDAQWERLYESMAFQPPDVSGCKRSKKHKTRRVHGRRALTPMRRHHRMRAITHHQKHNVNVVKLK